MIIKYMVMKPIFKLPRFSSHPEQIYNKSLKWFGSDRKEIYEESGNEYGPNDIEYRFNSKGFRCDEFSDSKVRIVFLGCSVTAAIGVKQEEGWAYQLLQKIRADTQMEIPFWNLGMGGAGLDAITRAYYCYHDILKPHIVFAYLPAYRREIFIPENTSNVPVFTNALDNILSKHETLMDPRTIHYETEKNLAFLDLMINKHNTLMFWNSWGYDHYPDDFQNRHGLSIWWDMKGRDKSHPGPIAHHKFASEMYSQLKDQILDKIKSIDSFGS